MTGLRLVFSIDLISHSLLIHVYFSEKAAGCVREVSVVSEASQLWTAPPRMQKNSRRSEIASPQAGDEECWAGSSAITAGSLHGEYLRCCLSIGFMQRKLKIRDYCP